MKAPTRSLALCAMALLTAALFCPVAQGDAPAGYRAPGYDSDDNSPVRTSKKPGWKEPPASRSKQRVASPWWADALLWIPNRVMDFIDIFRVDVGIGPTVGGVARASRSMQVGYRVVRPFSLRVGAFGRHAPFLVDLEDERGVGDSFRPSASRRVCQAEFGLGLDIGLGAYGGICGEELLDSLAGIVMIDLEADDL